MNTRALCSVKRLQRPPQALIHSPLVSTTINLFTKDVKIHPWAVNKADKCYSIFQTKTPNELTGRAWRDRKGTAMKIQVHIVRLLCETLSNPLQLVRRMFFRRLN